MFAIFLTEAMDPFYKNISSFPTLIFTILLLLCTFYWLLAVVGVVDLDFLDLNVPESDLDVSQGHSGAGVLGGLLIRLGLNGVPLPVVVSLLTLFGWFISYYAVHFLGFLMPNLLMRLIVGLPILIGSTYLAALITSLILKPLRPIFESSNQQVEKNIIGMTAIVRTAKVDQKFGEATVEDGGAGLIVKIRTYDDEVFERDDRVVLLEYLVAEHAYRVIAETEFNQRNISK